MDRGGGAAAIRADRFITQGYFSHFSKSKSK